jgi:hypothetical protein
MLIYSLQYPTVTQPVAIPVSCDVLATENIAMFLSCLNMT